MNLKNAARFSKRKKVGLKANPVTYWSKNPTTKKKKDTDIEKHMLSETFCIIIREASLEKVKLILIYFFLFKSNELQSFFVDAA